MSAIKQKIILITRYICLFLCINLVLPFSTEAGGRNGTTNVEDAGKRSVSEEPDNEGLQQTLDLNFSPEHREKLRRALDDYARSVDPAHDQIEERRRAMQESIEARFLASDKDNDGTIDRQEATESLPQIARHFSKVDTNEDEVISLEELVTAQAQALEHRRAAEAAIEAQKLQNAETIATVKRKNKQTANNTRKRQPKI